MLCYPEASEGQEVCLFFTNTSTEPGTCLSLEVSVLEGVKEKLPLKHWGSVVSGTVPTHKQTSPNTGVNT